MTKIFLNAIFLHFAIFARCDLTLGSCDRFSSFVVISIMAALKVLHEVTACI